MKREKHRSPFVVLALVLTASAVPLLLVELFYSRLQDVMASAFYLVFHNIAEFASIMVSLSIFGVGWYTYDQSRDRHALFLSAAFLAVGLMDFMHALGYEGMPAFITPNSANKSTQFWIAARLLTAAAFLASAFLYPDRPRRLLSKGSLMAAAVAISGVVFAAITFFPAAVPATFIEGSGLTPFKKISEYVIIFLLLVASAAYGKRMARTGNRDLLYYRAAFILCIFSELAFAIYKSVFDPYTVLGHIYKAAAFFLIYRGIFVASVTHPYVKLAETGEKLEKDITKRERAEEALHRLNRELRAISRCSQALARAENEQALLDEVCRIVCGEAGYRMAWAGYAEQDGAESIRPVAWAGVEKGYLAEAGISWAVEQGRGPAGTAIRSGRSVCIQDFTTVPQSAPWRDSALQRGYRSGIALPLKDESAKTFGVLGIYSAEPKAFTADEVRLLEALSGDLAFGIMILRGRGERDLAEESLSLRNRINEIFLTFPGDEMYGEVLQVILAVMKSRYGVFGYRVEEGVLVALSSTMDVLQKCRVPDKRIVFPRDTWGNSIWSKTILKKRGVYVNEPIAVPESPVPIKRALDVPILYQGEAIGHFLVGNRETGYDDHDKEKLEGIARSLSAILNARLQQERQERQRRRAEDSLRKLTGELEQRVRERTAELEKKNRELGRFNRVFVGRELRMVELKKRIRELEQGFTAEKQRKAG